MSRISYTFLCAVVTLASLVAPAWGSAGVEVLPERPVEHRLVRVKHEQGHTVAVVAYNEQTRGIATIDQARVDDTTIVFTGAPGKYLLLTISDQGTMTDKEVVIAPSQPGPGPKPIDDIVVPDKVVDRWGFGKAAYAHAAKTGDKAGAAALAKVWHAAEAKLWSDGSMTVEQAVEYIRVESQKVVTTDKWQPWATAMAELFEAKGLESNLDHIRAIQEVANALDAYVKS